MTLKLLRSFFHALQKDEKKYENFSDVIYARPLKKNFERIFKYNKIYCQLSRQLKSEPTTDIYWKIKLTIFAPKTPIHIFPQQTIAIGTLKDNSTNFRKFNLKAESKQRKKSRYTARTKFLYAFISFSYKI